MIVLLFKMVLRHILLRMVKYIPWTQGMRNELVHIEPRSLEFIPDHFKTQEMCNEAVEVDPCTLKFVPVHLRTYEIRKEPLKNIYIP